MFESLQEGLSSAFKTISGKARLTESNMRDGLREVQQALLEADVSLPVVKQFIERVSEEALGERVLKSLNPSQQVVGLVYQELTNLMGPVDHSLHLKSGANVIMLCGLQGSGKTTTCGKLAKMLAARGRKSMLVAADLQRPAAIEQLHVLGQQLGVPVYSEQGAADPVKVCQNAVRKATSDGIDVVILDTAGRLHIDDALMQELRKIDERVEPQQVYLVVDGMTGQDAVNSAKAFNEALELNGVVMTKLDGDARGGAALSVKQITGVPIKFIGVGEQLEALEEFHPDRMAQRILGMGDVLTLVETAQQKLDQDELAKQEEQLRKGQFTLDDFKKMLLQVRRLGSFKKILGLIPGMGDMTKMLDASGVDAEKDMTQLFGIIDSMTPAERRNPKVIDTSRRRRIAAGAGVEAAEVNNLVKQFDGMAAMMKQMAGLGMRDRLKAIKDLQKGGMMNPGAKLMAAKKGTGKRLTTAEKKTEKKRREAAERKKRREGRKGP